MISYLKLHNSLKSLSSSHADSTKSLDSLSSSVPISHCSWLILHVSFSVYTILMNVSFVGWLTMVCPYGGIYRRMLLMSLSLLFLQYPACLVRLIWIVCEIGSKWSYSYCFVGCYFQDLLKTAHNILV